MDSTRSVILSFLRIGRNELRATFWAAAYFFFLLGGWYVLRPLREEMGVRQDVDKLPHLYFGTLILTILVTPFYSALVARLPRERFIPIVYHVLAANIVAFSLALRFSPEDWRIALYRGFYIWSSMFNMFAISVFWGCMADIFKNVQGRRLFGLIAAGGTAGGIAGSYVTGESVKAIGIENLMLVAAVVVEVCIVCFRQLMRAARADGVAGTDPLMATAGPAKTSLARDSVRGMETVARSPYLLVVCLYMLLFTAGSTFVYFEQSEIVARQSVNSEERAALFSRIDFYVNVAALGLQLFAIGPLIAALGMPVTMAIMPLVTCGGFLGLGFAPSLAMLTWFQVARRGGEYAVAKTTRDLLYTVVSREEKYSAKGFIDTFVYRGGDLLAAWGRDFIKSNAGTASPAFVVAMAGAIVSVAWCGVAVWLGVRQERMARSETARGHS